MTEYSSGLLRPALEPLFRILHSTFMSILFLCFQHVLINSDRYIQSVILLYFLFRTNIIFHIVFLTNTKVKNTCRCGPYCDRHESKSVRTDLCSNSGVGHRDVSCHASKNTQMSHLTLWEALHPLVLDRQTGSPQSGQLETPSTDKVRKRSNRFTGMTDKGRTDWG